MTPNTETPKPSAPLPPPRAKSGIQREALREPIRRELSDDEILRMFEAEDADQFNIDPQVIPPGWRYEWKRHEVWGQGDDGYIAELMRHKMQPVLAEEHPGYFMPIGYHGQVVRQGLALYKMEERDYANRDRFNKLIARRQVNDQEQVLGLTPVGQFERKRASIKMNYEAVDVE